MPACRRAGFCRSLLWCFLGASVVAMKVTHLPTRSTAGTRCRAQRRLGAQGGERQRDRDCRWVALAGLWLGRAAMGCRCGPAGHAGLCTERRWTARAVLHDSSVAALHQAWWRCIKRGDDSMDSRAAWRRCVVQARRLPALQPCRFPLLTATSLPPSLALPRSDCGGRAGALARLLPRQQGAGEGPAGRRRRS